MLKSRIFLTGLLARSVSAVVAWFTHPSTDAWNEVVRTGGTHAARVVVVSSTLVRVDEATPEAWAQKAPALLGNDKFHVMASTVDSLVGELLADAPTLDISAPDEKDNLAFST